MRPPLAPLAALAAPATPETAAAPTAPEKIVARNFSFFYQEQAALGGINLAIRANEILAIIGPARSGKSTFLRALNRLTDLHAGVRHEGDILLDGASIFARGIDVPALRRRVGMVYDVPVPLPMSIFDNLAYGPRRQGITNRARLAELAEKSLRAAILWDEVKDRLQSSALRLSGGQQQRLCMARALALQPEVLLLDEPCSGLDPISTAKIEDALWELKKDYTIVLVTNNVKQAARASERTAFILMGELVEIGETTTLFTNPVQTKTSDYVTGKFG
jgi:phosphate transport system ATP-binding protein